MSSSSSSSSTKTVTTKYRISFHLGNFLHQLQHRLPSPLPTLLLPALRLLISLIHILERSLLCTPLATLFITLGFSPVHVTLALAVTLVYTLQRVYIKTPSVILHGITVLSPLYSTHRAIETQNAKELQRWNTYWAIWVSTKVPWVIWKKDMEWERRRKIWEIALWVGAWIGLQESERTTEWVYRATVKPMLWLMGWVLGWSRTSMVQRGEEKKEEEMEVGYVANGHIKRPKNDDTWHEDEICRKRQDNIALDVSTVEVWREVR